MKKRLFLFVALFIMVSTYAFYALDNGHRNDPLNSVKENGRRKIVYCMRRGE